MAIIPQNELRVIAGEKGFGFAVVEKDYLVTYLLFLLKDVEGIYFKGGTALNKIFLGHARLSEDLDFTATADIKIIEGKIREILKGTIFEKITNDKRVDQFVRLIVHYKMYHDAGVIFIDLNERGKLLLPPESHEVKHFYADYIPRFSVKTLHTRELMAEKMSAAICRNRPRDHFDLYQIILKRFPLDMDLVRKKCELSSREFDITKMFNNARKLKNQWNEEMEQFLQEKVSFETVMTTLARHFRLKEEKKKKRLDQA